MPKANEEIANEERDEEEDLDEEEEETDEDESDEDESEDDEDADPEDDDDDSKSDSDDDGKLPKSRKELDKIVADAVRRATNRRNAGERTSKKRFDQNKPRAGKPDAKIDELSVSVAELRRNEEKRQFGYANGLAPDEVDVVFRLKKTPTAKSLKDPIVQGALDGYRAAKRAKDNTPRGSGNGRPSRVQARDDKDMTPAEKQDRFTARRQQILAGKKN